MDLITTTSDLAAACSRLAQHKVITVDTEFLRETTYYPCSASCRWRARTRPS
jgi:ribonuclease D